MKTRNSPRYSAQNSEPDCINDLYSLANYEKRGIADLGFSRDRFLILKEFFNHACPSHKKKPLIIVAGTKGKGSTCHFLYKILKKVYKKVGLFTSPHIYRVNERIVINGRQISSRDFDRIYQTVMPIYQDFKNTRSSCFSPSVFEVLTLMAKMYFDEKDTGADIFEAGLGGRLDAVNCLPDDRIAVITSISLDHTAILGDTCDRIFLEKIAVARKGQPLYLGFQRYIDIKKYEKRLKNYSLISYGKGFHYEKKGTDIRFYPGRDQAVDMKIPRNYPGFHLYNLCLALAVASRITPKLLGKACFSMKSFNLPCRFEVVRKPNRLFIIDAAHNKDSLEILFCNIKEKWPLKRKILIFGCLKDKDIKGMLEVITRYKPDFTIFQDISSERNHDFKKDSQLKGLCLSHKHSKNICETYQILSESKMLAPGSLTVITGSFYLCSEHRQLLKKPGGTTDSDILSSGPI